MTSSAADSEYLMPPEWAPHARCWMAWPCRESLWGEHLDDARRAYAEVATSIARFEPVTMVATPENVAEVSIHCGGSVACVPMPHDDSWMRDVGPTFVKDSSGKLVGIDWRFNGWGDKYAPYDQDAEVARNLLESQDIPRIDAGFVLEGGSIHVDGEGTLLTSEQCLLNPNRNPQMTRGDLERELGRLLGVTHVIWLGQGLEHDETDGHVDNLACFVRPGVVLALSSDDPDDGNYEILQDNLRRLRSARDARGRELEVIEVQQPRRRLDDDANRLALSYVNFYIANGAVIMPAFEDSQDKAALETVSGCFPDHEVVQIVANDIVYGGGGIHCITQQQPAAD